MNQSQLLQKAVQIGDKARAFLSSELGQYVADRAQAEIDDALEKLANVDPTDSNAVRQHQNDLHRAESALMWLAEAIQNGDAALQTMELEDATD